jgi:hypothetical protein
MSKRVVMLLVLAACGPSLKTQVKVELEPLPADQEVKVFAAELPTCAYQEVGLIASQSLKKTIDAARKMGADGVIGTVLAQEDGSGSEPGICGTLKCIQYNTLAIRFTDPACTN